MREEPDLLRQQLLRVAALAEMTETVFAFGRKYVGIGEVIGPSGRRVRVRTVWVVLQQGEPPVLVTAYPA